MQIDLNCDLGESFGAYTLGSDAAIMPLITSANIACGFHAGDPQVIARTVRLAVQHGVAIGAHPGFPDRVGFGRRALDAMPDEIENDVLYQIGALAAFARAERATLAHVKPHGALYNLAATRAPIANAITRAIARFDANLILVAPPGSALERAAREQGLHCAREGFADRAYNRDGSLRSRREPGALIDDPRRAAEQALQIARAQTVTTPEGETIAMPVDTLCVHGDSPGAANLLRAVREMLLENGVKIAPMKQGSKGAKVQG
jgi:UPF0271 protein